MSEENKIRPITCGIAAYFLLIVFDVLNITIIGSALKIAALIPISLMPLQLKDLKLRIHPLVLTNIAFWLLALISIFYSVSYEQTLTADITLTLNLMLVLLLGSMVSFNDTEIEFLQKAMLVGCWLQIVMTVIFADYSADGRLTLRFGESTQDHNTINTFYLFAFSYHCYRFMREKKGIHLVAVLLIIFIVLISGSRGALIAYILTFVALIGVHVRSQENAKLTILTAIVFVIVILVVCEWFLTKLPERVSVRFSWEYIQKKGSTGRSATWAYLLTKYVHSDLLTMIFGHGYGTTTTVNEFNHNVAHNLYIDNLITLGIVGTSLQIVSQGTVLWIFYKFRRYELFCAYIGMIGMCMSLSLTACKPLWNMMLLALIVDSKEKNTLQNKERNINKWV